MTSATTPPPEYLASPRYAPISDYGVIGDLHSAALISRLGSIDWFCAPRFDSPAIFARLLDAEQGGSMSVIPDGGFVADSRRYLPGTNCLQTRLSTTSGRLVLTDFMAVKKQQNQANSVHVLVRLIEAPDRDTEVTVQVDARFRYGQFAPEVEVGEKTPGCLTLRHQDLCLHIDGPGIWANEGRMMVQKLHLRRGQPQAILLLYDGTNSHHLDLDAQQLLSLTCHFWEDWIKRCQYNGPYRDLVLRSALLLKLLIYAPEGSMVAAPTTSLPEAIGGRRNWDYRFTWLRDSAFLIYALQILGYQTEAADFIGWLERINQRDPAHFQIMYGIDGRVDVDEQELNYLDGYQSSKPVRIGNGAGNQNQMDIYGEVIDSAYLHLRYSKIKAAPMRGTLVSMIDQVVAHWEEPDSGIWEQGEEQQHYLYSKLQCWVALDRGLSLAKELKIDAEKADVWSWTREQIRHTILTRGWSAKLRSFRQVLDEDELDATALMIPLLRFLPALDPRMRQTVTTIQNELTDENGFVYRYKRHDGLVGDEGTFLLCSFWLVDNLALQGQLTPARDLFERLTSHGNDLGLFSEELDPNSGDLLGNFPQAFTHLAIVNAAAHLERAEQHLHLGTTARGRF